MAAVLDEAMGAGAWLAGHAVVAAKLTINFRRMLPLENEVLLETWVERVDGKKVMTRGRLFDREGEPYAEGEGLFIMIGGERFGTLLERASKTLDKALEASPDEPELHIQRGYLLAGEERTIEARTNLRKFLDLADPSDPRREQVRAALPEHASGS